MSGVFEGAKRTGTLTHFGSHGHGLVALGSLLDVKVGNDASGHHYGGFG